MSGRILDCSGVRPDPSAMITPELRARIEGYDAWYHEFDFGDGVVARPRHPFRELWNATEQFLAPVDFRGKSVLDIGCWDGFWSFYAERRGAASVLATDDNTQHWAHTTAGWGATESPDPGEGFILARTALDSRVNYRGDVSIYHLDRLATRFDVILCLGVFYHLTHLMSGLTQLRHAVKPDGCVILEGAASEDEHTATMDFLFGPGDDAAGRAQPERNDPSNWSVPTVRCLCDMLRACYFDVARHAYPFAAPRGRVFVEARPFVGANLGHPYRPPFGLDRYDPRFGANR